MSRLLALAATGLAGAALTVTGPLAAPPPAQADAATSGDVIANLWEWSWPSIAQECTDHLGPAGYGAVQVAPPSESLKQAGFPWWDVYQPYSYSLDSRFGTAEQFSSMVAACHTAGVKVYVDAVINHTAAVSGTGYDGTTISTKYDTPDFDHGDYHHPGDGYCNDADGIIDDWNNLSEVQNCELLGLADLKTSEDPVRGKIAGYLNKLLAAGVDGFRIDAVKHIAAADMAAIEAKLTTTTAGTAPYIYQEVYPGTTPQPGDYFGTGDVLDFTYASKLKSAFQGSVSDLGSLGSSGILPAANAVDFVTNHDTERNGLHLSYKDGATYVLANLFQLANKHAAPTIHASFTWNGTDDAPPNSGGYVTPTDCSSSQWHCLNRDKAVVGMVGWHNAVGSADVSHWQTKSSDVIGFGRSGKGFFALNNGASAATYTFATGMADGSYQNVVDGGATSVTVSGGNATLTIPAKGAVAFRVGATCTTACGGTGGGGTTDPAAVSATFNVNASTALGTNVYVVGSTPALGNWNPASAVPLSASGYPIWSGQVTVPSGTTFQYKFIKKDSTGAVTWESIANRSATSTTAALSLNHSWNLANADATDVTFKVNATTEVGTNVYVVGSIPALGSWDPKNAVPLSSATYPVWARTAIVPKGTTFSYKYIKKNASGVVTWESGGDRSFTTGAGAGYQASDSWR
jgi:alpha-amylase